MIGKENKKKENQNKTLIGYKEQHQKINKIEHRDQKKRDRRKSNLSQI